MLRLLSILMVGMANEIFKAHFFFNLLNLSSLSSSLFLDSLQFNVNNFPHAISIL